MCIRFEKRVKSILGIVVNERLRRIKQHPEQKSEEKSKSTRRVRCYYEAEPGDSHLSLSIYQLFIMQRERAAAKYPLQLNRVITPLITSWPAKTADDTFS